MEAQRREERAVFVVFLESRDRKCLSPADVRDLVLRCPVKSASHSIFASGNTVAKLIFYQWPHALDALAYFWERCLKGPLTLPTPDVKASVHVPSDKAELDDRLRPLFAKHARSLLECEAVRKVQSQLDEVNAEVGKIDSQLGKRNAMRVFMELQEQRMVLLDERELLVGRLDEFRAAMRCLLSRLGDPLEESSPGMQYGADVLDFGDSLNWRRIHWMMIRECRRLREGLPIYAFRRMILNTVNTNQVTVLIGETGSGKSTQLVQYLTDSGLAADRSIVCTQPRKIAAMSLGQRVREESCGCYADNSVVFYSPYSSQKIDAKVVFMTDHSLLQHFMGNMGLAGISYIIVDEAHERSLNTDLVLALIKKQLLERFDLRLIIMSATADAEKLSEYFYGCQTVKVKGRTFPVEVKHIPDVSAEISWASITKNIPGNYVSYVSDVVKMVSVIHQTEGSGDVLAFLTSQTEVEWACENFQNPSAVVLPMHGKLSNEEQCRVFQKYPGKRKVIFSTNLAETSLTIPGIKYVVDSGMVKESKFEPSSGMNVLKVCPVSQGSAKQRMGRAGRTEPGKCYRLYSKSEFESFPLHQDPEIRKVHLGIAVLRILSLSIGNVTDFEFIDAPSPKAIDMATQNLIHLGAVVRNGEALDLTDTGWRLVKLGIEPRLGKLILDSYNNGLSKEGVVLAAVMANASSIFCRVGTDEDKCKADCLKVPFCHYNGDLFTLLSVYRKWEFEKNRNQWCWDNSINAKSMRRCHDTVLELEHCLRNELKMIIPSYWKWDPNDQYNNKLLKKVILNSLPENVAIFSGSDRLGYEVALTGEHIQLHPSCSLLIYGEKPKWVVFAEILSISRNYLVCVTAIDRESLYCITPPLFDVSDLENHKLEKITISQIGKHLLKRLCGKKNRNLQSLVARVREICKDTRADAIVEFDRGVIEVFASAKNIISAQSVINDALDREKTLLKNECTEKPLFGVTRNISPSVALFGPGGQIKHLELENRYLTVELFHPNSIAIDDKELLVMIDNIVPGLVNFYKYGDAGSEVQSKEKWGKLTFLRPELAQEAVVKLNGTEFCGCPLTISPVRSFGGDHKVFPANAVRVKIHWPRRPSKGLAFVRCNWKDADSIVQDCANLVIGGRHVRVEVSTKDLGCVILGGLDRNVSETEIFDILRTVTEREINDVRILRGDPISHPPLPVCEEALLKEISPFLPSRNASNTCQIEVFAPEPKDSMMKAVVIFDGSLHLEAAKALDHLQGKVLSVCQPWQKIECQQLFRSSLSCSSHVYHTIKNKLDSLLQSFNHLKGVSYEFGRNENGSYRVNLCATATKIIADLRRPLESLMKGKTIMNACLTPNILELLLSHDGVDIMKSVEQETGTCIHYDRHRMSLKIFGSDKQVFVAEESLAQLLLSLHEKKQLEISLRGPGFPPGLMKEVATHFGPDLHGLKDKIPEAEFVLNTRRHRIHVTGKKEAKQKAEKLIMELAQSLKNDGSAAAPPELICSICLCELEEPQRLEGCGHEFCRTCLLEQCESAMKSYDGFPLVCAHEGCKSPLLLADLKFLLGNAKLEELFRASLGAFVSSSGGAYRYCPTPDCPSIYKVADPSVPVGLFVCGACSAETCTKCHLEYHPLISCELYKEFKDHPDSSLLEWKKDKEHVKNCPSCGYTIEKVDGCNHIECKCGKHICWVCLVSCDNSNDCYAHLREVHESFV